MFYVIHQDIWKLMQLIQSNRYYMYAQIYNFHQVHKI